jgi:flagellar P-ring protein precursor FlgI
MKVFLSLGFLLMFVVSPADSATPAHVPAASEVRLKDLGRLSSSRDHKLVGYGLVTGLASTGDSPRNRATRQSLANVLSRFDLAIGTDEVMSRNVAAVMVTASMPMHARPGDALDVTVTSIGDARSLAGGLLLMAPLKGADGRVHALAQGALTVGGHRYDAQNNLAQRNHPTVGVVSGGAVVEVSPDAEHARSAEGTLTFVLADADFTTAGRVADALNAHFGAGTAEVRDAAGVEILLPNASRGAMAGFVRQLEALKIQPDRRARVVVNERTGTVVAGGDVRIAPVSVAIGDLRVTVEAETAVSQPFAVRQTSPEVRTAVVTNSRLSVDDREAARFLPPGGTSVTDLVQALVRLKATTREVIAVLQAVKAAGALHADLIVQ